jgi:hypothetical protein
MNNYLNSGNVSWDTCIVEQTSNHSARVQHSELISCPVHLKLRQFE